MSAVGLASRKAFLLRLFQVFVSSVVAVVNYVIQFLFKMFTYKMIITKQKYRYAAGHIMEWGGVCIKKIM